MKLPNLSRSILSIMACGLVLIIISCASINSVQNPRSDIFDTSLERAKALFYAGDYRAAQDHLKILAEQKYSTSRMDELLRWMERCELCLADPFKSRRQVTLIEENLKLPD
jgi:hypothetical protein